MWQNLMGAVQLRRNATGFRTVAIKIPACGALHIRAEGGEHVTGLGNAHGVVVGMFAYAAGPGVRRQSRLRGNMLAYSR